MITTNQLNTRLLEVEYAVRGPIVTRAQQMEEEGRPVVYCNIGNPQAFGQAPLTFVRQMLCLLEYAALLDNEQTVAVFPEDVVQRVRGILRNYPMGLGAYSHSAGVPFVRKAVAEFIARRDGIDADASHVIMTDGASKGAQLTLSALLREANDGIMVPVPQYPLYSASLTVYGGHRIDYYLDEENGWQLSESMLLDSFERALDRGIHPVGIVVINPGNPTGAVLSEENIEMIIGFARNRGLAIIADEVYQDNVYRPGDRFHSFAKVMHWLGDTRTPLFSLHSVSKGFLGECGHRGGYLELRNLGQDVVAQFIKQQAIALCANVPGQMVMYCMVAPPREGDASYEQYVCERDAILSELKGKAQLLCEGINQIEGMHMEPAHGAMYAFVSLCLPDALGVDVSSMDEETRRDYDTQRNVAYCLALLEETGICVVPGSGFGQRPMTMHFRTTFLPPRAGIEKLVQSLGRFHERYCEKIREGRRG